VRTDKVDAQVLAELLAGDYKRKYGPRAFTVPFFRRSGVPALGARRDVAEKVLTRGRR
jgi:hypothetical protein